MEWYYAADGEQRGPVQQDAFDALVADGTIGPSTLVWHAGMADWQPWAVVGGGAVAPLVGASVEKAPVPTPPMTNSPPAVTIAGMALAGFGPRLGAKLVDWVVVYLPISFVFSMISFSMSIAQEVDATGEPTFSDAELGLMMLSSMVPRVVFFFYQAYCYAKWSATLGKRMLGLKVVDSDGAPLSGLQAVGRAGAEILTGLTCFLGYLTMLLDSQQRTLHDFIAATRVVRAPKVETPAPSEA